MKKTVRNFFLILLSFMIFSSTITGGSVDAAAAESFDFDVNNQNAMNLAGTGCGTLSWGQSGIKGKENAYGCAVTGDTNNGEFRLVRQAAQWVKSETKTYMVLTAQIMPENDSTIQLFWGTNGNISLSSNESGKRAIAQKLVKNRWNTLVTVYNLNGNHAETYVNGVQVYNAVPQANLNNIANARLQLHVYAPSGSQLGIDNIHMYQTNEIPDITMPSLNATEKYSISGDNLILSADVDLTLDDLDITGQAVRVYRDDSMENQIDKEDKLSRGNIVVIEDQNGGLTYYRVTVSEITADIFKFDENNKNGMSVSDTTLTGNLEWCNEGIQGKNENDGYANIVLGSANSGEGRLQKGSWTKVNGTRYLVLSADLFLDKNSSVYKVMWGTNNNGILSQEITRNGLVMSKMKKGIWNNFTTVYDMNSMCSYTYVNGMFITENQSPANVLGKRIQFHVFGKEGDSVGLDNLYAYQTSRYPEMSVPKILEGDSGTIRIYSNRDTKIGDLSTENIKEIRLYCDSSFKTLNESGVLEDNNILVAQGKNNELIYYTVTEQQIHNGLNMVGAPDIENDILTSVSLMPGTDIVPHDGDSIIAAAYTNGRMSALQVQPCSETVWNSSETKKVNLNMNLKNADTLCVMIMNLNTMESACQKAEYNFNSGFDEKGAIHYFYPDYKKKAVSFSMDDGIDTYDKPFVDVLNQYGLKGTFNLNSNFFENFGSVRKEEYIKLYSGHEVGNHVRYHPEYRPNLSEDDFKTLTPVSDIDGMYYGVTASDKTYRYYAVTPEAFIVAIEKGKEDIEALFGKGTVKGFTWPGGNDAYYPNKEKIDEYIGNNYTHARETGQLCFNNEFPIPEDMSKWETTVYYNTLEEYGEKFINQPVQDEDDLMLFTVGTHARDYIEKTDPTDNGNYMDNLERFCSRCKDAEKQIWSATMGEIAEYIHAKDSLTITSNKIINNSDIPVFLEVKGKKISILPGGSYGK